MTPDNISPQLLDKYLNNQCTDDERELVEKWFASLRGESDFLGSLPENEQLQLQNDTFTKIQNQLNLGNEPEVRKFPLSWITWLAASVLLVLGIYFTYNLSNKKEVSIAKQIERKGAENIIEFINSEPRVVKHQLPDGSSVWMHTNSAIRYPKEFDLDKRLVTFSGEGFFDISKDKSRPFSIQSGEMVIRVLGTSFNVKAPSEQKIFQISVVTGRVEVSAPDKEQKQQLVVLTPKQEAFFETGSKRLVFVAMAPQMKKEIYEPVTVVFNQTPLNQVVDQLEKRFDIKIKLANPGLSSCRVSGDFEKQSLPGIMEMLCTTLEANYTMSGKIITIDGLPCNE
ncbi:FecR domain-containing protein [Dyadobacter sp. CY345]|uniref:FecR family protein n=1 Tax=Dyadobacter sp. CY345 TaxID=2909335 RepID=UPI001F2ABB6A|nr:FecR domain-containing protein [Dyadobacter sp. CY345]MCF2442845.1 FecR domain-containing protein [Dyadobacter sp. CY345]